MDTLILATGSTGKITELRALLSPIHCISQRELHIIDAEETGLTFLENAIIKARHASTHSQYPALADDSGLVIDALNGRPGIYSARFSGAKASDAENIDAVLSLMSEVEAPKRTAYFFCAMALMKYADDPTPIIACGRLDGFITLEPKGAQGFGYDPIFFLPQYNCTLAQLGLDIKNQISHRARALHVLKTSFSEISCYLS